MSSLQIYTSIFRYKCCCSSPGVFRFSFHFALLRLSFCSSKPFILTSKIFLYQNGPFGEPFKIQWATTWHPNRPSCVQNLHLTSSPACLFSVLILGCILIALWFTFGVFLVPVGSRFPLIADARKRTCNVGRKMKRTC